MQPKVRQPAGYARDHFHGRFICRRCSAEVHDWSVHDAWHDDLDALIEDRVAAGLGEAEAGIGPDDLAARANAEGRGVVDAEFARPRMFGRETWRQVAACLSLRLPRSPRPAAAPDPPVAAGRAEQWARIDTLIKRTTEA
jgi:hypothetical protein